MYLYFKKKKKNPVTARKLSVTLGVRCNDKKILLLGPIKRRNCNSVKARFLDIITRFFMVKHL